MHHVLTDPPSGKTVRVPAGSGLELRFRRTMSRNRWQVADLPGNLVPLVEPGEVPTQATAEESTWALRFLVFANDGGKTPLRLELTREDLDQPAEVRKLNVVVTT
ncbi:MAG: hypothetical protein U0R80_16995 [Nocardioidaceae bacterium]